MKKIEKRDYSLYGLVYPNDMKKLEKGLDKILPSIKEIYSSTNPHQLIRIEFDFKRIKKGLQICRVYHICYRKGK